MGYKMEYELEEVERLHHV